MPIKPFNRTSRFGGPAFNHHPSFDKTQLQGWKSMHKEKELPYQAWKAHVAHGLEMA